MYLAPVSIKSTTTTECPYDHLTPTSPGLIPGLGAWPIYAVTALNGLIYREIPGGMCVYLAVPYMSQVK